MKLFALALAFVSTSAFAANCFTRLDSDLGLKLSQTICFNSVLIERGVADISASFDGVELTVTSFGVKGDYCYDEGQVTGIIRYAKN